MCAGNRPLRTLEQPAGEILRVVDHIAVGHIELMGVDALGRQFLDERDRLVRRYDQHGVRIRRLDVRGDG